MSEELKALEENGVWTIVTPPENSHVLHTIWVSKTKSDADGGIERFKARLVACGNEKLFGVDYGLTFASLMDLSTVKVILVLAMRWGVPARHGDIPNAYVKVDKEEHLEIYLAIPQGMDIPVNALKEFGVNDKSKLALRLKKSLYGLKQAGRLWSQLLHAKLEEAGFTRCGTDMCLFFLRQNGDVTVAGVYVDDLLVTASNPEMMEAFCKSMNILSVKELGEVRNFLGMRVILDNAENYTLDQPAAIEEMIT
uniref:Retrotransposon 4 protein putative n=1 Tax=Albugo laibachii Nc14 TaxID=890382 RepID=F0VYJ8_9STRA|nr:retrotransposon 4 protein putative [Albugo laibachii Nc14]|eukprot:CCA13862.1 retrotransposon 4 protein putative [Albugo laibachii Nc14]